MVAVREPSHVTKRGTREGAQVQSPVTSRAMSAWSRGQISLEPRDAALCLRVEPNGDVAEKTTSYGATTPGALRLVGTDMTKI